MFARSKQVFLITPILPLLIPANIIAAETVRSLSSMPILGFSSYTNNYFKVDYPSGWSVNETLLINSTTFSAPNNTAHVVIGWGMAGKAPSWIMDKDAWLNNSSKYGANISMASNDTNYLSNHRALVVLGTRGALKELNLVTVINGTMYGITYMTSVINYPYYLNQVDVMIETFHVRTAS